MNTSDTIKRLEGLAKVLRATQDTEYQFPGEFTRGITTGLRIALKAVDDEIQSARDFEAALAAQH